MELLVLGLVVGLVGWWGSKPSQSSVSGAPAAASTSGAGFPGGADGLEETVKWIALVDPKAKPDAIRGKLVGLKDQGFLVAIPGDMTAFAFWLKLRGPTSGATLLSDDDARAALAAVPSGFASDVVIGKGAKLYKLAAPIVPGTVSAPATPTATEAAAAPPGPSPVAAVPPLPSPAP